MRPLGRPTCECVLCCAVCVLCVAGWAPTADAPRPLPPTHSAAQRANAIGAPRIGGTRVTSCGAASSGRSRRQCAYRSSCPLSNSRDRGLRAPSPRQSLVGDADARRGGHRAKFPLFPGALEAHHARLPFAKGWRGPSSTLSIETHLQRRAVSPQKRSECAQELARERVVRASSLSSLRCCLGG